MIEPQASAEQLIARCLGGDQSAYEALYSLYAPSVYRLCYSLLLNRQDAEDVLQESFVYAFRNLRRYDASRAAFKTWLYTIAISRCRNHYRRRSALLDVGHLFQLELPAPYADMPEPAAVRHDARAEVERALAALSPRLREAVVLRYGQGMTYREIADVMDCPAKTAESRVRLAHEALKARLQTVGLALLQDLLNS
jgi:RNA polymerase sigma-70 factor (ECF subfamily)